MSELKPVAYIYPQFGGNPPDGHYEVEGGLVLIENIDDLADWEKKAGAPLYEFPDGYVLVKIADYYADKGAAQKAFWHALEFCNDPDDRNIRKHWENYKAGVLNK